MSAPFADTPSTAAPEDTLLIAIGAAQRQYQFQDDVAARLFDCFANPSGPVRRWIFETCDPQTRDTPFAGRDDLAAFTQDVSRLARGEPYTAKRWLELGPEERRFADRILAFARDKRRVLMGGGRPQNVDRALILYVIHSLEEIIGIRFRFSRPALGGPRRGPMLSLADAALRRLFWFCERMPDYLGLVSPAQQYTQREIVRTAEMARQSGEGSPLRWPAEGIVLHRNTVLLAFMTQTKRKK